MYATKVKREIVTKVGKPPNHFLYLQTKQIERKPAYNLKV